MQYFYIVGYMLIGNDLTLCKVSLNEHTLISWARKEAIKHDFRTYQLYKQPITRTGKITFVRQIKPSKKPIDIQTSVVPFDWGEFEESQQNLACEEHSSHHNKQSILIHTRFGFYTQAWCCIIESRIIDLKRTKCTGEELIKKAYQDSEKSGREYERVVRYVESILADEQKEQKNEKVRNRIR